MSDTEQNSAEEKPFCVDRPKQGRAACKKCKEKCLPGELRIGKLVPSPFGSGKMKSWHHLHCIFEQFLKQRATTKRIESPDDLDGWDDLNDVDKEEILKKIEESEKAISEKNGVKYTPKKTTKAPAKGSPKKTTPNSRPSGASKANNSSTTVAVSTDQTTSTQNKDLLFKEFRRLVEDIANVSSYTEKTSLVNDLFSKGRDGKGFKGNLAQWCRLLLPGSVKRIYNLQNKQLIKLFSKIFNADQVTMLDYMKQGDIADTIVHFFEQNKTFRPSKKSTLTVQEVDDFLEELSRLTKEDDQINHFKTLSNKCTCNELRTIIRLIKHDLRMNAGAKHILLGVHPDAYEAFQASGNLEEVIERCLGTSSKTSVESKGRIKANINLMTPVQPMLAEPCKSVEQALKKFPNGMYVEIKYDGERVQLHKHGNDFMYYSRSLKPVLQHKVSHFKEFIPKAFPHAKSLILDSEILMVDTVTGDPLPFGTLGIHKKNEFKDANVCLFVFDCMYYNGKSLIKEPLDYRKNILRENMTEIENRIMFSQLKVVKKSDELSTMINDVLKRGLEGLVLKDLKSIYEPGKRHWLKIKKDYLHDGAIADTADLIVLGAWYGTGKKAGMMSVFLMGCYDSKREKYCTVTKVHTGHDDKTLEQLQNELKMEKISCDPSKVPDWLKCTRTMVPDFVAEDPTKQPVWEITGAEFTQHDVHTADGISIRFPRVTKIREDKTWENATTLEELKCLFQKSKETTDIKLLTDTDKDEQQPGPSGIQQKKIVDFVKNDSTNKRKTEGLVEDNSAPSPKALKIDSASDSEDKIKEPLPSMFRDVKLLVEKGGQDKFQEWLRYFIGYGGMIVKPEQCMEATHVLHLHHLVKEPNIKCSKSAQHVAVGWIKDSITSGVLEDHRNYMVIWEPLRMTTKGS